MKIKSKPFKNYFGKILKILNQILKRGNKEHIREAIEKIEKFDYIIVADFLYLPVSKFFAKFV